MRFLYEGGAYHLDRPEAIKSDLFWVFLFAQIFSFFVLTVYVISSMVNPVVMFTIGYNQVNKICAKKLKKLKFMINKYI